MSNKHCAKKADDNQPEYYLSPDRKKYDVYAGEGVVVCIAKKARETKTQHKAKKADRMPKEEDEGYQSEYDDPWWL